MKSTKWIKDKQNQIQNQIDNLEKEMNEKGITYEDSRNHMKHEPIEHYSIGSNYHEELGRLVTQKILLEEFSKPLLQNQCYAFGFIQKLKIR